MKTDLELQKVVQDELLWEPILINSEIGVTAKDGVIMLTGTVGSYAKKLAAEKSAKTVMDVKAVAQELSVRLAGVGKRTDTEIAQATVSALEWNSAVPHEKVKLKVENGWVKVE